MSDGGESNLANGWDKSMNRNCANLPLQDAQEENPDQIRNYVPSKQPTADNNEFNMMKFLIEFNDTFFKAYEQPPSPWHANDYFSSTYEPSISKYTRASPKSQLNYYDI